MIVYKSYGSQSNSVVKRISLGHLTPQKFLHEYWQKKPLLIRAALPDFQGLLSSHGLKELACQDDVQSRLVTHSNTGWHVKHGPLDKRDYLQESSSKWTVLVQDVNHHLHPARDLLSCFNFLPHARLDDLMVSYAPMGGGIGAHIDSYDVFLLQGEGERRWQISAQQNRELIDDAPLKILKEFTPEQEWVLQAGDMLYLPPGYAHHGIAETDCMTYSIGFRAPSHQEIMSEFLIYLQDNIEAEGFYNDPELPLQDHPAQISAFMQNQVAEILGEIKWTPSDIHYFLGQYLSEPKPHVVFNPPTSRVSQEVFSKKMKEYGIELDLKSRMLMGGQNTFYLNGERYTSSDENYYEMMMRLADSHELFPSEELSDEASNNLYQWYQSGYIVIRKA